MSATKLSKNHLDLLTKILSAAPDDDFEDLVYILTQYAHRSPAEARKEAEA